MIISLSFEAELVKWQIKLSCVQNILITNCRPKKSHASLSGDFVCNIDFKIGFIPVEVRIETEKRFQLSYMNQKRISFA